MNNKTELIKKILELKKQHDALILVHNYQLEEVQDIADFLGDSLDLSKKAAQAPQKTIVFCGVHFMAETAKILAPKKIVLLPDINSGCPLANMITKKDIFDLKKKYPKSTVVGYINTPAEIKSEIDYCCTSANAVHVVQSIGSENIIFIPDKYLGAYVKNVTKKNLILWNGFCPTHVKILEKDITKLRQSYPKAKVVVHPECTIEVQNVADEIAGTAGMIKFVQKNQDTEVFIIGTEVGMCYRLSKLFPEKKFIPASKLAICPNMKKNSLEKILWCLQDLQPQIFVEEKIRIKAYESIKKMYKITENIE